MFKKKITATVKIYGITSIHDTTVNTIARYTFSFPDCYLEFKISDIEKESPNACYIKIYGISKDTYKLFDDKKFAKFYAKQNAEIYVGYDGTEELVYSGTVSRVKYNFNFGEQSMEILLDKNSKKFKDIIKSTCLRTPMSLFDAVSIICAKYGYKLLCPEMPLFKSILIKPTTVEGSLQDCLKSIVGNSGSYYVDTDTIILYSKFKEVTSIYNLTFENGLISLPSLDTKKENDDEVYRIKSTLIPSMKVGAIIGVPIDSTGDYTSDFTGMFEYFVVREYVSTFSSNSMTTEMECEKKIG